MTGSIGSRLRRRLQEFEAVAPGIFGVETADAGDGSVVRDFEAASEESVAQFVEVGSSKSGVRFSGGAKILFDADVDLLGTALEPAAASGTKRLRLLDFSHSQKHAVKIVGRGFAAFRSSNLNVIDTRNLGLHDH
jgi:hypothetical protein